MWSNEYIYNKRCGIFKPVNSVGAETNVHNSQEAIIDIKI